MRFIEPAQRFYKLLSVFTFYALVIQLSIPCARAMEWVHQHTFDSPRLFVAIGHPVAEFVPLQADPVPAEAPAAPPSAAASSVPVLPEQQKVAGGPGQNDNSGLSLNAQDGVLNKFTGDMSYSIPLLDIEGFPIVISYNANITMDQEASWVGLGWDLSVGSINRDMRGIPDDFAGDAVERVFKTLPQTINGNKNGVGTAAGVGIPIGVKFNSSSSTIPLNAGINMQSLHGRYLNNYTGVGHTKDFSLGLSLSIYGIGGGGSLGYSKDDQNGIGRSKSYSFTAVPSYAGFSARGVSSGKTFSANSRDGMKSVSSFNTQTRGFTTPTFGNNSNSTSGSFQTFGVQTYFPRFSYSSHTTGTSNTNEFGGTAMVMGFYGHGRYIQMNDQATTILNVSNNALRAYGYYHLGKSRSDTHAMLDFNREGSGDVSKNSKHLGFSAPTQDMYYVSAPGLSANYRAHRYEVFRLNDPEVTSTSVTENSTFGITGIVGVTGVVVTAGVDIATGNGTTNVNSQTGTGYDQNTFFKFSDTTQSFDRKEYYLKSIGEQTPVDLSLFHAFGGDTVASLDLRFNNNGVAPSGKFSVAGQVQPIRTNNANYNRGEQVTHYREYTGADMAANGLSIVEQKYTNCMNGVLMGEILPPVSAARKAHHVAGTEIVNANGMRYVFGIPAYNYMQKEVAFSASRLQQASYAASGLVQYGTADNTVNNTRGRQQLYDATTVPGYAQSLLLTQMLSSDYVDRTGNGPSIDDAGNYYRINYSHPFTETAPFKWRLPMAGNSETGDFQERKRLAYFQENLASDPWDDVANYIYGEKDLWYTHSVESKNFIAYFCVVDRQDQFSAVDENGGLDFNKAGKYLARIELVAKGPSVGKTRPIQVIEFNYDYSLCPGYPGNENTYASNPAAGTTGKLTLKSIYSYSFESGEGKTLPIEFEYGTGTANPAFALNSSDRWGSYKPNNPGAPNHLFPMAEQNKDLANQNAQAWKLKKVLQATGAEMEFTYEADSYAYVQQERAMRMFRVIGMSDTETLDMLDDLPNVSNEAGLYSSGVRNTFRDADDKKAHYDVVYFALEKPITGKLKGAASVQVQQQYFTNALGQVPNEFLFSMFTQLGNKTGDPTWETVQSMATLDKTISNASYIGVVGAEGSSSNPRTYYYGYVIIASTQIVENKDNYHVTPLQLANWQFARLNAPYTIYGAPDYGTTNPLLFCDYSNTFDHRVVFQPDVNKQINRLEYGLYFNQARSFIRLFEPDSVKFGGNARLISVKYSDNWEAMSGEAGASYTWRYSYGASRDGSKTKGVASYEPKVGGEENAMYNMDGYMIGRYSIPDEKSYQFVPLAEMVFPAPVVGYEEVITTFGGDKSVGKVSDQFYTSRQYPVIIETNGGFGIKKIDQTDIPIQVNGQPHELLGFSEGYLVKTNDFHGQIKETSTVDAGGNLISRSVYNYYNPQRDLMQYLKSDGQIVKSVTPREIDMYMDSWRTTSMVSIRDDSETYSAGVVIPGIPPLPFMPYFFYTDNDYSAERYVEVRGFTFQKLINNSAVVKSVDTYYLGSHNTAQNEVYDAASGEVLLSSLQDEFNDRLYSLSYPAHWKYPTFGNMNTSDNGYVPSVTGAGSTMTIPASTTFRLHVGDHLKLYPLSGATLDAWVLTTGNGLSATLINAKGALLSGINWPAMRVRIFRAGQKNLLSAEMMNVTTKSNPVPATGSTFLFPTTAIQASAMSFQQNSDLPCEKYNNISVSYPPFNTDHAFDTLQVINPFLVGVMGNYRMESGYAFQMSRISGLANGIRQSGNLQNYQPFYRYAGGQWVAINESSYPAYTPAPVSNADGLGDWRRTGVVDTYNWNGQAVQSTDQLKISQVSLEGENNFRDTRQTASAVNAKLQEIAFDGFEIYSGLDQQLPYEGEGTGTPHFSLRQAFIHGGEVAISEKHSGNKSMAVADSTSSTYMILKTPQEKTNITSSGYQVQTCNCIQNFNPATGADYLLSVWVKELDASAAYTKSSILVQGLNAGGSVIYTSQPIVPGGAVIEGWQKAEGKYILPAGTAKVRFVFLHNGSVADGQMSYFDDFRTHPFLAGMQSAVYDPITGLPLAEHDGYNFTTFYNYDENYQLVRIKVETIDGIQTISETESGSKRKY
jgi:hypothetical protein